MFNLLIHYMYSINVNFGVVHFLLSLNLVLQYAKLKGNNVKFINCPATVS